MFKVLFFQTEAGRSSALDYLWSLPDRERRQVLKDLDLLRELGFRAPVSKKAISCKKQNQEREIDACAARMRALRKEMLQ